MMFCWSGQVNQLGADALYVSFHSKANVFSNIFKALPTDAISTYILGTLAPAREVNDNILTGGSGDLESQIMAFLTNVNLIVPVVAALAVIIIAIIVICVIRSKNNAITKGMFLF